MKQIIYIIEIAVPKLVWITAISIIYILFGTNNTFSLRFCLAERETKLERSEKFVDSRAQTCLDYGIAKNLLISL